MSWPQVGHLGQQNAVPKPRIRKINKNMILATLTGESGNPVGRTVLYVC